MSEVPLQFSYERGTPVVIHGYLARLHGARLNAHLLCSTFNRLTFTAGKHPHARDCAGEIVWWSSCGLYYTYIASYSYPTREEISSRGDDTMY